MSSAACVLLPTAGPRELLPPDARVEDVLGPGPLLRAPTGWSGCAVEWRAPHAHADHNPYASRIAGQVGARCLGCPCCFTPSN
jgi:hypothetical protein